MVDVDSTKIGVRMLKYSTLERGHDGLQRRLVGLVWYRV